MAEESSEGCEAESSIDDGTTPSTFLKTLATFKKIEKLKQTVDDTRIALDKKILSDRYFFLKRQSE